MGEVYRARDTKLNRDVAIKVLPDLFAGDAERLARFTREAQTLAALNHPNIAHIHGLEESNGVRALVMEFVEGEDLSQRIARGAISLDEALPIARQITDALEAAHERGIIHRDLKPANIKVRSDGTVKVLDFGLAKALEATGTVSASASMSPTITTPAMTQAGMILGTAAYLSPEQAKGKPADKRSDVWAFGCVLYEMLTGTRAFGGDDLAEAFAQILEREPNWKVLPVKTPASIRRLLRRALAKDRKERLADVADARIELRDALTAPDAEGTHAVETSRARPARLAWSVAAVAIIAVAALAIPAVRQLHDGAPESFVTQLELNTPPTPDPFSFALSPDGRQIVFVGTTDNGSKLWLRPFDQTTARPLVGTDRAGAPFWSPDGRAIGFFADSSLKRIDLTGGPPQVLAGDTPIAHGGTWSRNGVIVFASQSGLKQVADTGGATTAVAEHTRFDRWPQFLPDGRRFLFYSPENHSIYLGSLDGGEPTRLLAAESAAAYAPPGYLLLLSQGALVARRFDLARGVISGDQSSIAPRVDSEAGSFRAALSVSASSVLAYRGGTTTRRQLVWVDRMGKALSVLVPPEDTGLTSLDLAPDGSQAAVARIVQGDLDIWLIEVARGLVSRFTFDRAASPLWSPDAKRLVFRSVGTDHDDLFEKPANRATDEQPLLVTAQNKAPLAWSSDGWFLLYAAQDPKAQSDLWALPMTGEGERTPIPIATTNFDEIQGQFSRDGRWVAYASNESMGRYEIYIRPFPGPGNRLQVSTAGGIYPRWGRDAHELFYVAPDNRMMAARLQIAADDTVVPDAPVALFATRLISGNTGYAGFSSRAQYAVAPDGRFLLNVSADDTAASPITIVQNWTVGLKP